LFCNANPIGFGGGTNWYAFAGNNPISAFDPFGLKDQHASGNANYGFNEDLYGNRKLGGLWEAIDTSGAEADARGRYKGAWDAGAYSRSIGLYWDYLKTPGEIVPGMEVFERAMSVAMLTGGGAGRGPGKLFGQVRALNRLGVDRIGRRAFFAGEIVGFQFPTEGGDPIFGFVQLKSGQLTSQLFAIKNPNQRGAINSFFRFRDASFNLARAFSLESIELQGGAVRNPDVANMLLKLGFRSKIVPVPISLGGGVEEALFKIYTIP
jgi:hypothetical protein